MPAGSGAVIVVAVRGLPALAAEIHDMRADHQILHHEARVAFEAGAARWCGDFDGPFLVAPPPGKLNPGSNHLLGVVPDLQVECISATFPNHDRCGYYDVVCANLFFKKFVQRARPREHDPTRSKRRVQRSAALPTLNIGH